MAVSNVLLPQQIALEPGETPILLERQHWYVFRDPVIISLFIPFVLLSAIFFLDFSGLPVWFIENLGQLLIIAAGGAFVLGVFMLLWKYYLWKRTFYLVTNKRLILYTQYGLFHSDDRECSLAMIQDVKAEIDGIQASLYGFGNVIVQVSSKDAQLVFQRVAKPHQIQREIMREAHLK